MNIVLNLLASTPPAPVPETGATALLFGAGVVGLGVWARFRKNRKK